MRFQKSHLGPFTIAHAGLINSVSVWNRELSEKIITFRIPSNSTKLKRVFGTVQPSAFLEYTFSRIRINA